MTESYTPAPTDSYLPVQWLPRDAIEPNDWNPNEMADDERKRLKQSLLDTGWTQPIVVHATEYYIIDGEQRWTVAGSSEIQAESQLTPPEIPAGHVPVYGITVDDGHARLATVQHNRARGDVEMESLRAYLQDLRDRDVLEDVHDRIGVSVERTQLLLDEVTARDIGAAHEAGFGAPWEPVERHERSGEEMTEDRSLSMQAAADDAADDADAEQAARDSERLNFVLTDAEADIVRQALGSEQRAQSLVNLIDYVLANELLGEIRDHSESSDGAVYAEFREAYVAQHPARADVFEMDVS